MKLLLLIFVLLFSANVTTGLIRNDSREVEMAKYLLLRSGDSLYLWDKKAQVMYEKPEGSEDGIRRKFNLQQLSKFVPNANAVSESKTPPRWLPRSEAENYKKLMGLYPLKLRKHKPWRGNVWLRNIKTADFRAT